MTIMGFEPADRMEQINFATNALKYLFFPFSFLKCCRRPRVAGIFKKKTEI